MKCRSCQNEMLHKVLDLGNQPWCNDFRKSDEPDAEIYPLRMVYCSKCTLAQLDYTVKKEVMFSNHTYVSGTTTTLRDHFYDLAKENKCQFNLQPTDLIVDIGGNDGTQLLQYEKLGFMNLLNIESAANIALIASSRGVNTVCNFFNEEWVDRFQSASAGSRPKAKLINASGVFFHLEELHSVCRGVRKLLDPEGVFVVQFMYLKDIVFQGSFDAIYHEHLCYYTLRSLENLLQHHGLILHDAVRSEIHGGSMIAKFVHTSSMKADLLTARAEHQYEREKSLDFSALLEFAHFAQIKREQIIKKLQEIKATGAKIYGLGAPAKGTTLLTYCGIGRETLDKMHEVNHLKCGLVTPGSRIPIVYEDTNDLPDYYFVLSWNFIKEILSKQKEALDRGVKFIVPLPEWRVYDKYNF